MPRGESRPSTKRKQAQAAARLPDERYQRLVESAQDVIFTLDANGAVTSLNHAFESVTGWPRAAWIGKSFSSLLHPDDVALARHRFQRVLVGESQLPFELRVASKSGDYVLGEFTATPQTRNGAVVGVESIARDVTARKQSEQKARQEDKLAALGVLLGGVAHELNNPLFIISGYAQLAKEKLDQKRYEDLPADLETIREAAQRASAIVNRFLGVARRADVTLEPCRVDVLMMQALDLLSAQFALDRIAIRTHVDADLPSLTANAQDLTHVFMNLFANAHEAYGGSAWPWNALRLRDPCPDPVGVMGRGSSGRRRSRHRPGASAAHLRSVLYHQAVGAEHRPGAVHLSPYRHGTGRRAGMRQRPGRRCDIRCPSAGADKE